MAIDGSNDPDTLDGTTGADTINGLGGNDTIRSFGGADEIYAGEGDDTVNGEQVGVGLAWSGFLFTGPILVFGDAGDDDIIGTDGNDTVDGGADDDFIVGREGADSLLGQTGNDTLQGGDDADVLEGGADLDSLFGQAGNDTLDGGAGNDSVAGGDDLDSVLGGSGNDTVSGNDGADFVDGGADDDEVYGGTGNDTLLGSGGKDSLYGNENNDSLTGGDGDDDLFGMDGDDTLVDDAGFDLLSGGLGNDTFIINSLDFFLSDEGGSNEIIVNQDFVKVPTSIDATPTYAAGVMALPYWLDAMLPEQANRFDSLVGAGNTLSYAFPTTKPGYVTDPADSDGWLAFNAAQKAFTTATLSSLSSLVNLTFLETATTDAANVLSFANNSQPGSTAGYAYYPNTGSIGSDIYFDKGLAGNLAPVDGEFAALTFIHEILHALGLKHPFEDGPTLQDNANPDLDENNTNWTVMSYDDFPADYHPNPQPLDIAALHYLYGPSTSANAGNSVHVISESETNFIYDGGGTDTVDASAVSTGVTVYLTPGYWGFVGGAAASLITSDGQITVNFGTIIESLWGSASADKLVGNHVGNDIDANGGNDTVTGGAGNDTLDGGGGTDNAMYSGPQANYSIVNNGGSYTVTDNVGTDGTDTLTNFENAQFSDGTVALAAANSPPTGSVDITGVATEGQTLGADTTSDPIGDSDGLGVFAYQWKANDVAIDGATAATFELTQAEVGKTITVTVNYQDGAGNDESVTSGATVAVSNIDNDPEGTVEIAGVMAQGETLTASNNLTDEDGLGAITYQWKADGAPIDGATNATFILTQNEVGKVISVTASYTDQQGSFESVTELAVGAVANVNDDPEGNVLITGTATEDQVLSADASGLSDADGIGEFGYQWQADGVDIAGATGSAFQLGQNEVGKIITVTVSYTDEGGAEESVDSAATLAVVNLNDEPGGSVTIAGTASQGSTLTASNTLTDDDGLGVISYQWNADGAPIAGATGSSYELTATEIGKTITVTASYTDGQGTAESETSAPTGTVTNVNAAPTGSVTVTGTAAEGQTLTVSNDLNDPDGNGPISYQWNAGGVPIAGATGNTFQLTQAEVGQALTVTASYTDGQGTSESVISDPTGVVANVDSDPTGSVVITGTATQGQILSVTNNLADADGLGTISYQWKADGVPVVGATNTSLFLTQTQVGRTITVTASYTDGFGSFESVDSNAIGVVANINDEPLGEPSISGTAAIGQILTADPGGIADQDGLGAFSYQWQADGIDVAGATGSSLALTADEVGKVITVNVSYTDGGGTVETVPSAATDPVQDLLLGTVADGYVSGASLFVDANADGVADPGENTGLITDANGQFTLPANQATGPLLAIGGINIDTGLANSLLLTAPQGGTVLNPITTLIQGVISAQGGSVADAEAAVQLALNIDGDVDLVSYDPLAQGPQDADAVNAQSVAAQLAVLATLTPGSDVFGALAAYIVANAGQVLSLDSMVFLQSVLPAADQTALNQASTVNGVLATADSLAAIADTQLVALNETNDAPLINGSLNLQFAIDAESFEYAMPGGTFIDLDPGDSLTYSAAVDDALPLPAWLSFDAATQTFSGTPGGSDIGRLSLTITATDTDGESATAPLELLTLMPGDLLGELDGNNGFRLDGVASGDRSGWSVDGAGDFNGDGFDDLIIGAFRTDAQGNDTGSAYLVLGRAGGIAATSSLADLDGSDGFRIDGLAAGDRTGMSVSGAGDVNGDGYDDVIIGAEEASPQGVTQAGASYVIFGSAGGSGASFDLNSLDGSNGFRVEGEGVRDLVGGGVNAAGDINGDGFADLVIGARETDFGATASGSAYILFGKAAGFDVSLDLTSLDGSNGFRLDGTANFDRLGGSASAAGDVNGDGYGDLIAGASLAGNAGESSGSAYLLYGGGSGFAASISVDALDGVNGFRLDGQAAGDRAGILVSGIGDINNDGFDDLLIGAHQTDFSSEDSGSTYVVFGSDQGFPTVFGLGSLDGSNGFRLDGIASNDETGEVASIGGDFNGDSIDDVLIGAWGADISGNLTGSAFVVYGSEAAFSAVVQLGELDGSNGFRLDGDRLGDLVGYSVNSAGDFNKDGADDIIIGAPSADYGANLSGSTYILFGEPPEFTGELLVGGPGPDTLTGTGGDDTLRGFDGRDTLAGLGGNDRLEGGDDIDHALYQGARTNYLILNNSEQLEVTGPAADGSDELVSLERLHFTDVSVAYDLGVGDSAGNSVKLLGVMLGAASSADTTLRGIAIDIFDNAGLNFEQIMDIALDVVLPGGRSSEAVVNLLWQNLVGGTTPQDLLSDLADGLDSGAFTQTELAVLAAEVDINLTNIGLLGLAENGLDYLAIA